MDEAKALVDQYLAGFPGQAVPGAIKALAVADVRAALAARADAPNGVVNFSDGMGGTVPVRVPFDPLRSARPLLAPWLGPVIG